MGWRALFCCRACRRLELEGLGQYALIFAALFVLFLLPPLVVGFL